MRTLFRISILLGLAAGLGAVTPRPARAEAVPLQAKPKGKPKAKDDLDTERLKKSLEGDEAQALSALDELAYLLGQEPRIAAVHRASSGAEAVRLLSERSVDAAFLDIHMPGLSGFDLARALGRFEHRPALVFVTADEDQALEAFEFAAVDYLLKPVRLERLARTLDRVIDGMRTTPATGPVPRPELVAVTLGGTTRMIRRDDVRYVQAQGDYARLHTDESS